MDRWALFTDDEITLLVELVGLSYSEGVGRSGNDESDQALSEEISEQAKRRGMGHRIWWMGP